MASKEQIQNAEPVWHELIHEVDQLPVFISTPERGSCTQGCCRRTDGLTVSAHWHEHLEFLWLTEGHMTAVVQADTYELEPGDLLIINSGELHMTKIDRYYGHSPYVLIQMPVQKLETYFPGKEGLRFSTLIHGADIQTEPMLLNALEQMRSLYQEHSDGYQLLFQARFCEFLYSLSSNHSAAPVFQTENAVSRDMKRVMDIMTWVGQHYPEAIRLEDAADRLSISKEYFCRIFKKYTGQTFLDYLCMTRTTHLYEQLQTTDLSIPELMERNGLTNYKTFLRTFHCLYGATPQKIRLGGR